MTVRENVINFINYSLVGDGSLSKELYDEIVNQNQDCVFEGSVYDLVLLDGLDDDNKPVSNDSIKNNLLENIEEFNELLYFSEKDAYENDDPYSMGLFKVMLRVDVKGIKLLDLAKKYNVENSELYYDIQNAVIVLGKENIKQIEIMKRINEPDYEEG